MEPVPAARQKRSSAPPPRASCHMCPNRSGASPAACALRARSCSPAPLRVSSVGCSPWAPTSTLHQGVSASLALIAQCMGACLNERSYPRLRVSWTRLRVSCSALGVSFTVCSVSCSVWRVLFTVRRVSCTVWNAAHARAEAERHGKRVRRVRNRVRLYERLVTYFGPF